MGDVEGVLGPVQVEAGHLDQRHPGRQVGIGLAREHLDMVAEGGELLAQVVDVDALAARVRIAAVDEECDAKGARHGAVSLTAN